MSERLPIKAASVYMDPGTRPVQEDYALVSRDRGIFAVADGFGGPGLGEAAAKTACESIRGFLEKEAGDMDATLPFVLRTYFSLAGNVLFNALIHSNRRVNALNQGKSVYEKAGASVVAGFLDGDLLAIASVGGCSASLFRNGEEARLVIPRTLARLCDPFGSLARGERAFMDAPLMAMGTAVDLEPEIAEYRVLPGDWLLLHTDGMATESIDKIKQIQFNKSGSEAVDEVLEVLKHGVGEDNLAVSFIIF